MKQLASERTDGVMFAPGGPYLDEWNDIHVQGWSKFCHSYTYNVCPPTDDQPFFFNTRRPSSIFNPPPDAPKNDPVSILLITLGILLLCVLAAFLLPLLLVRRTRKPPSAMSLAYFAAIGLGYLLVEIVFIQRFVLFLGFPTYSLSVVLFSLLTFTGVGSFLTPRVGLTKRTLNVALAATVVLLVFAAFGLAPMLAALIEQPFAFRVVVAILVIAADRRAARCGDADRAAPLRGPVPRGVAICMGRERPRVRRGVRARRRDRPVLRLPHDDARCRCLLRRGTAARRRREMGAGTAPRPRRPAPFGRWPAQRFPRRHHRRTVGRARTVALISTWAEWLRAAISFCVSSGSLRIVRPFRGDLLRLCGTLERTAVSASADLRGAIVRTRVFICVATVASVAAAVLVPISAQGETGAAAPRASRPKAANIRGIPVKSKYETTARVISATAARASSVPDGHMLWIFGDTGIYQRAGMAPGTRRISSTAALRC